MLSTKLLSTTSVGAGSAWNVNAATYDGTPLNRFFLNLGSSQSLAFKSDGTKLYVVDATEDAVHQFNLSAAWDVSTAVYLQKYLITQDAVPNGLFFKPDGTKMYITGNSNDGVYEYDLSVAWDISTTSYVQSLTSGTTWDSSPTGLSFKDDGTRMYILGDNADAVNQYTLSTAWDISTAVYSTRVTLGANKQHNDIFFKDDGTKMYITGTDDLIYPIVKQYDLSSAWDVSTASLFGSFTPDEQYVSSRFPSGLFLKSDGTKLYNLYGDSVVYTYGLSGAWDISTTTFTYPTSEFKALGTISSIFFMKPDGLKIYLTNQSSTFYEYNLSVAWDISTIGASAANTLSTVNGKNLFFRSNGTDLYFLSGTNVAQYVLSTAWNISTATSVRTFSISAQDSTLTGLFFKDDGTKMYVTGDQNNNVYEYALSTGWDISTATYTTSKSVSSQTTRPFGLFFKTDGTKMYIVNNVRTVFEYSLATAWDISTATISRSKNLIDAVDAEVRGVFFKDDGTKMYISRFVSLAINNTGFIYSYDL